jgi:ring-1,2-phenylacetyl-CoA epoxidase subunit PaaE
MLKFHSLRVTDLRPEGDAAVRISLAVPEELRAEYRPRPGQHIVLRTQLGGEEVRRTYSVISTPQEPRLDIAVRVHAHGRLSKHLAEQVRPGDMIDVLPPNGSFGPREGARRGTFVAFASGCGITPVTAIVEALLTTHADNRVVLFHGNRNSARAMLLEDLLALKDRFVARLSLHFVMSREPQDIEWLNGRIDRAKVREFAGSLFDPKDVSDYFLCGPGTMIDDIGAELRSLGVDAARIHGEHFTVATLEQAPEIRPAPATQADGDMTRVNVVMDGRRRSFPMRRGEETILDAAERAGLDLPFSCRAGVCSTCRTRLVKGEVEMMQNFALEEWEVEQGFILACQSHARTPELEINYDER